MVSRREQNKPQGVISKVYVITRVKGGKKEALGLMKEFLGPHYNNIW